MPGPQTPGPENQSPDPLLNPFTVSLDACLANGEVDRAQSLYLSALRGEVEGPADLWDPVMAALLREGDYAAARSWAHQLLEESLAPAQAATVYRHLFTALTGMQRLDLVASYIPLLVEHVPADDIAGLMRPVCGGAIDAGAHDTFWAMINALSGYHYRFPHLQPFIASQQLRMLLHDDKHDEAATMLLREAATLPHREQQALLLLMARRLVEANSSSDRIDQFARSMLADTSLALSARDALATWWLKDAQQRHDYNEFLHRFGDVVTANVNPKVSLTALRGSYYEIRQKGNPAQQAMCSSIVKAISACEGLSEEEQGKFALLCLDDCFFESDFRRAQTLITEGVSGQDEAWHTMIYGKLGAHAALQEGRHEAAIAGFKAHMEIIRSSDQDITDPTVGQAVHVDAVLGFNEKRIGDIYLDMGRRYEAQAAYNRARKHCEDALTLAPEMSPTHKQAREVLAQLPASDATLLLH
jgi:tetratricopeptide (TPR) repeat protein